MSHLLSLLKIRQTRGDNDGAMRSIRYVLVDVEQVRVVVVIKNPRATVNSVEQPTSEGLRL